MRTVNKLIIHCSKTPDYLDIGVEEIREWHLERNFNDIGYHYVIRRDGTLEMGRSVEIVGAHCYGYNTGSIGICLVGLGSDEIVEPTDIYNTEQLRTLEQLIKDLKRKYNKLDIYQHSQFDNTKPFCAGLYDPYLLWLKRLAGNG